ncbi:MAG TPA: C25 family cysteine peptidase [Ferruginibacter sp.]|jgi:hypothetical protein|nr:C25 family cysteine peptidase [Ferruginibacter sp.]
MKRIVAAFFLLTVSLVAHSQLNNSWIDYSKTYYKFKVGQNGLYRINESVLASVGLGGVPAEQFELWRNGKKVRIFTSVATGLLGSTDYIEFLGEMNDGKPDKTLYRDSTFQLNDHYSLSSDTAAYFLTVDPSGGNLNYTTTTNNTSTNTLLPEPYFMRRIESPFKDYPNAGYELDLSGDFIYASDYDMSEGWTSTPQYGCCIVKPFSSLNSYTSGPAANVSFAITAAGNLAATREFQVKLFNTVIIDTVISGFTTLNKTINNIPLSTLENSDNASVSMGSINPSDPNDKIVVGTFSFTYPATFNFNNQQSFYFELPSSSLGNYLVITNFNNNGSVPVLYDKNTGNRYLGDITTPGEIHFELPPSTDPVRRFLLVSEDPANIISINALTPRAFINYANTANQGNYIIISNPALYDDGHGVNNVDNYRQYRASIAGGSYTAKVVSIDEITDQFAFGIKKHPVAVRDFIRYAYQQFAVKPQYVFIIGQGVNALSYVFNQTLPLADQLNLVPTFGYPASDVLLACNPGENVPLVPIGRISVVTGTEVGDYLQKMIEYESAQASTSQTIADKGWMKDFIHLAGGNTVSDDNLFTSYLDGYASIAEDTLYGANVQTFRKATTNAVDQINGTAVEQLINNGTGFIGYFGHASGTTLAFNLSAPQYYQNQGKYYFFNVSGCIAGDNYELDYARPSGYTTISEQYALAKECGAIGLLGSTYLGVSNFLDNYNTYFYKEFSYDMYGNTVGNQLQKVCQTIVQNNPAITDYSQNSFLTRCNIEEVNLNGDPALKINSFALPDYDVEDQLIKISPSVISVADNNFSVSVKWVNLGRAIDDSMRVLIERKLPNNTIQVLYNQVIPATKYADSVTLTVPINQLTDKGTNQLIVILDADNKITETSETNNTYTKSFEIFAAELLPVYPYNYSIINQQNITYSASTANPLDGENKYMMEVDTTLLFNSPFLKQYSSMGVGGVIQFTPTDIIFTDSTVYYWRTTIVPPSNATPTIWNWYSFVYLPSGGTGFNQSHYYQHLQSTYSSINLNTNRVFNFNQKNSLLTIRTGLYPATLSSDIDVTLDFDELAVYGCVYNTLQFLVYDSATIEPWTNYNVTASNGRFGSQLVCYAPPVHFFEFRYTDAVDRKYAIDFLDSIPNGKYVSITNLGRSDNNTTFIADWQADQATLGAGNDLYHKLKALGFTQLDSFTHNIPFLFFYQKNNSTFTPSQFVGTDPTSRIDQAIPVLSSLDSGSILSPLFGPAKNWTSLHWRGKSIDAGPGDLGQVQVYGVQTNGTQTLLATVSPATDTSLSFISAAAYPYLQLKMLNSDSVYATPDQLQYWRINADYLPEGAIAPNVLFTMQDTVGFGQKIPVALAFKNVSQVAFDSLQVAFVITDANNVTHTIPIPKGKALVSGDTLVIRDTIDTKLYPGNNTLYVMFNPNNDQPEQYLFNNFLYQNFFVKVDNTSPFLDVTFDGVHILNNDIVSAKPNILINLTDESKYLALTDTSLMTVEVIYPQSNGSPGGPAHYYTFGDSMHFIPANLATGNNVASIQFLPQFTQDGTYTLIVTGKDESGNTAGKISYAISFNVINKEMISNLLNYPNPFTTSTAFVFTITGSQIPQNMRIQILTITGKVVKEITQSELGPIHVGANITEYKWDGTDRYGQKLANGVYLYRVLTNLNGKSLEKYNGYDSDLQVPDGSGNTGPAQVTNGLGSTDQYFTKGYGKMYLMR